MATLANDLLGSVVETCERLSESVSPDQKARVEIALVRLRDKASSALSTPQRLNVLARAYRLAGRAKTAGASEAEEVLSELKETFKEYDISAFHPTAPKVLDLPRGDGSAGFSGRRVDHPEYTVRFIPTDTVPEGTVVRRLPGLKSDHGVLLKPHIDVAMEPFLDSLLGSTKDCISSADLSVSDQELHLGVTSAIESTLAKMKPAERNGAAAKTSVHVVEGLLRSVGGEKAHGLLDRIDEFQTFLDESSAPVFSEADLPDRLRQLGREVDKAPPEQVGSLKTAMKTVREGAKSRDRRKMILGVAEVFRGGSEMRNEDPSFGQIAMTAEEILKTAFGVVTVTEDNLRSFEWLEEEFEKVYTNEPLAGKPRGTIISLMSPGVVHRGKSVLAPRVLVSRGEVTRVHQVLAHLVGVIRALPEGDVRFENAFLRAKEIAYDLTETELEGCQGLELLFDLVVGVFPRLPQEEKVSVRTFFKSVFGAEIVHCEAGEYFEDLAGDAPPEFGRFPFDVQRVPSEIPAGTVIETLKIGLQSSFFSVSATLRVSRGPRFKAPLLSKIAEASPTGNEGVDSILDRMREVLGSGTASDVVLLAETIRLYDALRSAPVGTMTVEEVETFLVDRGLEKFPREETLLMPGDLSQDSHAYDLEFVRDETKGAGSVVRLKRFGWKSDGRVARKASVVVSLGAEPALKEIFDAVTSALRDPRVANPDSEAAISRLRRIYTQRIEPRLLSIESVFGSEDATASRDLLKAAVDLFQEIELAREAVVEQSAVEKVLDRALDWDFPSFFRERGLFVGPMREEPIDFESADLDLEVVFDDEVARGRAVRIVRRSIHRSSTTGGEGMSLIRRGNVLVSAGPRPEILRHLEGLCEGAGERAPAELLSLRTRIAGEVGAEVFDSPTVYEGLCQEIARCIDSLDVLVKEFDESDHAVAVEMRDATVRFVRFLSEKGVEVFPKVLDRPLKLDRFSELFDHGSDAFVYQSIVPAAGEVVDESPSAPVLRRCVASSRNRAVVCNGRLVVRGSIVVGGGAPDGLIPIIERIAERCPDLEVSTSAATETLRCLDDRLLVGEIEERAPEPKIISEKIQTAVSVIESLHSLGSASDPEFHEAWRYGNKLLSELESRFSVEVFPGEGFDVARLLGARRDGDEVTAEFGDGVRGEMRVRRFGYQKEELRAPFSVQVCLGPKPGYWRLLEEHPRLRQYLDSDAAHVFSAPELEIASILREFLDPRARPDDLHDFVVPRFFRIYEILQEKMRDSVLARELLGFAEQSLGVEIFPAAGSGFEDYAEFGVPERNVTVGYDFYIDDFAIDLAQVSFFGWKLESRVFGHPRLVVNRKEKSQLMTVLLDRLLPVMDNRLSVGSEAERKRLSRAFDRLTRFQLLTRESQDSPDGRGEIETLLSEVRSTIPEGAEVAMPEGMASAVAVLDDLGRRISGLG